MVPYEPLYVTASIVNEASEAKSFPSGSFPTLRYLLAGEDGDWEECGETSKSGRDFMGSVTVPPHESLHLSTDTIFFREPGGFFPLAEPGVYRLKARIHMGDGEAMESDPVQLEVVAGTQADAEAARILIEGHAENMIQYSRPEDRAVEAFRAVINEQSASVLAEYARFYLGLRELGDLYRKKMCEPDVARRAVEQFESISSKRRVLELRVLVGKAAVVAICGEFGDGLTPSELVQRLEETQAEAEEMGMEKEYERGLRRLRSRIREDGQ
jgi:hypothetical protein